MIIFVKKVRTCSAESVLFGGFRSCVWRIVILENHCVQGNVDFEFSKKRRCQLFFVKYLTNVVLSRWACSGGVDRRATS